MFVMVRESYQGSYSVGNICYRMGRPLRIHSNVTFDARYLLTRIITLLFCGICILRALYINDHKACLLVPITVDTDPANSGNDGVASTYEIAQNISYKSMVVVCFRVIK